MTVYYVRSTDGLDTDNGSTWALAKATIAGALALAVAGDRIWVSQVHNESATAVTLTSAAATSAAPVEVFCGNDGSQPPTARTTGAVVNNTSAGSNIAFAGHAVYYGITFNAGQGAGSGSACNITATGTSFRLRFENCLLACRNTNTGSRITLGTSGTGGDELIQLINTDLLFSATAQGINQGCPVEWYGGSLQAGSTPTTLFKTTVADSYLIDIVGVDLSILGSSSSFLSAGSCKGGAITVRDCNTATNFAPGGSISVGPGQPKIIFDNCNQNLEIYRYSFEGEVSKEGTLVKTSGASDGSGWSYKLVTSASRNIHTPLYSPDILIWNSTTGASKNIAVDVLHDNATGLTDAEAWIEVQYLPNSGNNKASFGSDRVSDTVGSTSTQSSSSATWTTTGMSNPNKQKLDVSVTPGQVGWFRARVALAKSSYTMYVDPKVTVT